MVKLSRYLMVPILAALMGTTSFAQEMTDVGTPRSEGECSFAIGFSGPEIDQLLPRRPNTMLLPMNYSAEVHYELVDCILGQGELFYAGGLKRTGASPEVWAPAFLNAYAEDLNLLAVLVKHPKFKAEEERRLFTKLNEGEHDVLEFRPRRTLLARHLQIDLRKNDDRYERIPITRIIVGPGPAQQVNKIAVGDLLKKYRYEGITAELSAVPYRTP